MKTLEGVVTKQIFRHQMEALPRNLALWRLKKKLIPYTVWAEAKWETTSPPLWQWILSVFSGQNWILRLSACLNVYL